MADVSDPRRPDDRSDDRGSALAVAASDIWRAILVDAARAKPYWRQTYQTSSPSLLAAVAEEDAIKAKHAGGRT